MGFFSLYDEYQKDGGESEVVVCGSQMEGCIGLKEYDQEPELFAPEADDGPSAATRSHLDTAAMEINDAIHKILSKLEKDHPKPPGTTGFDIVVTPEGFKLAYCKRADKVVSYRMRHERGLIRRLVAWLARPAYFKRERK